MQTEVGGYYSQFQLSTDSTSVGKLPTLRLRMDFYSWEIRG